MTWSDVIAAEYNWVWRAMLLAGLTVAVPSLTYFGLFELYAKAYPAMPPYLPEFLAAACALLLSLMTLKVFNDREKLGLDIKNLFSLRPVKGMALALAAGCVADLAVMAALFILVSRYFPQSSGFTGLDKMWTSHSNWFFVFFSTIIYSSCEEIFLRGLVLSYIKKHAGFLKALLVSSLLFSVMHAGSGRRWPALAAIFADGLIYGILFESTGGLAVPCLVHGLHNSLLRCLMLLGI